MVTPKLVGCKLYHNQLSFSVYALAQTVNFRSQAPKTKAGKIQPVIFMSYGVEGIFLLLIVVK